MGNRKAVSTQQCFKEHSFKTADLVDMRLTSNAYLEIRLALSRRIISCAVSSILISQCHLLRFSLEYLIRQIMRDS